MSDAEESVFFELYEGLPRQGPGSEASTREALRRLAPLPTEPRILDLGCGSGAQALVLARETGGTIVAVDLHQPFLDRLQANAERAGLAQRIAVRRASIDALSDPPGSYDLIWSEGAAYTIGVERALALWRPLLRPGGALAFSELTWLESNPPAEAQSFYGYVFFLARKPQLEAGAPAPMG